VRTTELQHRRCSREQLVELTNRARTLRLDKIELEPQPLDFRKGLSKRSCRSTPAPRIITPLLKRRSSWSRGHSHRYSHVGRFAQRLASASLRLRNATCRCSSARSDRASSHLLLTNKRPATSPPINREVKDGNSKSQDSIATATTAALTGLGLIDPQCTTVKFLAIQLLDGTSGIRTRHFDKAKTARATGITVINQR